MFLSVITPTYNRGYVLQRCYESLQCQTDRDFEWIVIDDGSTDDTERLIRLFIGENHIPITYIKQKNGGKQRAHNTGVSAATGELIVCLDSDDALSPDAVRTARAIWNQYSDSKKIGILAQRGSFTDHHPICSELPAGVQSCTMAALQQKYHFSGDTILFFRSDLLKRHLFHTFEDELFIPEDSLYYELDEFGEMILCDKVLYYCEYLPDGLTSKYLMLLQNNPMGTSYAHYQRAIHGLSFRTKLHDMIISKAYLRLSGKAMEYCAEKERFLQSLANMIAPLYFHLKIRGRLYDS